MANNSLLINQGTNSAVNFDSSGGTFTQVIAPSYGTISTLGTLPNLPGGTITNLVSGTINSATVTGNVGVSSGTINLSTIVGNLGTIGTVGLATVSGNIGVSSGTINVSTISTLPNIPGGTVNVATVTGNLGTIGTVGLATVAGNLGTIGTVGLATVSGNVGVSSGTINVSTISTLPNTPGGTINLATVAGNLGTMGTIGLATVTGNLGTIGTIGLATVAAHAVTAATVTAGTINTGTVNTGTINVATVTAGSIIVTAGTVAAGTVNTGTVNAGTVNVATVTVGTVYKGVAAPVAGSFTAAGSVVQAGSQLDVASFDLQGTWVGTVFFEAQIGTSSWFGVPSFSNTGIIGTQTTGNGDYFVSAAGLDGVRARLTYSSGTMTYNSRTSNFFYPGHFALGGTIGNVGILNAGTINLATVQMSSGTLNVATISTLPNLPQGSINVTAGTINTGTINLGTMVGKDANAVAQTGNPIGIGGTDSGGTIRTVTVDSAGRLTVNSVAAGTTVGTINAGTINTGTVNTGTINVGSVVKTTTASIAGSLTAAGTITSAGSQTDLSYWNVEGTWVGTVSFQGQVGTSSWFTMPSITALGQFAGTGIVGTGNYMQSMAGLDGVRMVFQFSSGTLTYNQRTSNFFSPVHYVQTMADQSNAAAVVAKGILISGYDGANGRFISTDSTGKSLVIQTAGTVSTGTVNTGTINTGTINAATVNGGTIQLNPLTATNTISNVGTSGTTAIGTLLASAIIGAGTGAYITYYNILGISGTPECTLAFGSQTNGAQVIYHGLIPAGGGVIVAKNYPHAYGTTNSPLTYQINSGAGTVSWSVDYFVHT